MIYDFRCFDHHAHKCARPELIYGFDCWGDTALTILILGANLIDILAIFWPIAKLTPHYSRASQCQEAISEPVVLRCRKF